jgi:hypothetical protein
MNVTPDEAAQALAEIREASGRILRLRGYHHSAPYVILWGLVWLAANTATQFWPAYAQYVWRAAIGGGVLISFTMGLLQRRSYKSAPWPAAVGRRMAMTIGVMFGLIFCLIAIAQPQSQREANAMISILFPFLYMCVGIWFGWRVFAIGLITAVAILFGYFNLQQWYDLWMGLFAGGSLIAGGIWLRTA